MPRRSDRRRARSGFRFARQGGGEWEECGPRDRQVRCPGPGRKKTDSLSVSPVCPSLWVGLGCYLKGDARPGRLVISLEYAPSHVSFSSQACANLRMKEALDSFIPGDGWIASHGGRHTALGHADCCGAQVGPRFSPVQSRRGQGSGSAPRTVACAWCCTL